MGLWDTIIGAVRGSRGQAAPPAPVPPPAPPSPPYRLDHLTAVGITPARAQLYLAPLNAAAVRYDITTSLRKTMFLAQIAHESGLFVYTHELWGPTPAQTRYEGRADLGNLYPGDGFKFRGRGLIQITGRANYEEMAKAFGMPLADFVPWCETPVGSCLTAARYWYTRGCNAYADQGDFVGVTMKINGGTNGIRERFALWAKAKRVDEYTP